MIRIVSRASSRLASKLDGQSMNTMVSPAISQMMFRRSYHASVVDHFEKPRNVGKLDVNDPNVGSARVGAPACGDVMRLQVKIKDGVVEDVKFRTFGCGSAIASSSYATEWLQGKTIDEALSIKNTDIAQHLSLPPVKLHCSMLAEDAVKSAIKDYAKKAGVITPGLQKEFELDRQRAEAEAALRAQETEEEEEEDDDRGVEMKPIMEQSNATQGQTAKAN